MIYERRRNIGKKKIDNILQKFDLQQIMEKRAHQISAGQKQKISLARSFILNCEIILLDEPLNYLDKQGKQSLKNYIYEEVTKGTSFVITTPYLKEWEDFLFDTSYLLRERFLYDISSEGKTDCMGYSESFTSRKN